MNILQQKSLELIDELLYNLNNNEFLEEYLEIERNIGITIKDYVNFKRYEAYEQGKLEILNSEFSPLLSK
jgi:hypothetical protein